MSTTIGSSASATVAARLNATAPDQEAEEYRKGRGEGVVWACEYATADELRDLVTNFERGRSGDFDNPHWRGFVAGAEEVLDAAGPRLSG